ncbi:MAG TPA: exonuclease domain-containing protein [Pyrinomonadaceae bacterium]|jgi:DNA polymerase-3 subunit alpha (Gram-positive type)|nr:exonuclease domain-containing protein [Pyrinomonadaceae bacterium]
MLPHPSLVSDSLLINDAISLLRSFGGRASAVSIVDFVMKIRRPEPALARLLVTDLIGLDPRLTLNEDMVELTPDGFDDREIDGTEFVVFDLETTGSKPPPDRIIEVGAYRVKGGRVVDEFKSLVNPEMSIPPFITGLTRISNDMVSAAPLFAEVATEFLDFIGDSVLVAHNSAFDMSFLNHEIGRIYPKYRVANPCLCTVRLSRRLVPDIINHKLKTLAEHYEVDLYDHHRAPADARATAHIFINLLSQLRETGVRDVGSMRRMGSRKYRYAKRPTD